MKESLVPQKNVLFCNLGFMWQENGFFVECGALDGEIRSNSLFFERKRNWTGLLIEAGPINYRQMTRKHRKSYISPGCLGVHPYPTVVWHILQLNSNKVKAMRSIVVGGLASHPIS